MYLRNLQYLFMEIKDEEICLQLHNVMISSQKKVVKSTDFILNHTVWKLREFSLTHLWQKFRESNGFTK